MNAFCPVCGSSNPATAAKVQCASCGTVFAAPSRPADSTAALGRSAQTNPLAIASLVAGALCCIPFASIAAIGTGVAALSQLRQNPGQKGRELAIAGTVLGVMGLALAILGLFGRLVAHALR